MDREDMLRQVVRKPLSSFKQLMAGDAAQDFTLQNVDGNMISLADQLQDGKNILLVFLRHLG
jgi:peroxiredoxin